MLARMRKSMKDKDAGFTLIELLVVMIIIGILAAIAIPVFLNQRKKAVDSSIKSDLRTIANAEESASTDTQTYVKFADTTPASPNAAVPSADDAVKVSSGNTFKVVLLGSAAGVQTDPTKAVGYCITGTNPKGTDAAGWIYNSLDGGLKKASAAVAGGAAAVGCPTS